MGEDDDALVVLALNVEAVHLPIMEEVLKLNHIHFVVTEDYSGYGSRGLVYINAQGMGRYTIKIMKKDEEAAIKLMEDMGFSIFNEDDEEQNFLKILAGPTERVPFLAKYSLNTRLSVMAITIAVIITIIMLLIEWKS